jgi:8-oxo-dGTP diphosphatase
VTPRGPVIAVGGIVIEQDSILLIQRATEPQKGRWSIPGGKVESRESLEAAVVREVGEETGLVVTCGLFVGWVERLSESHHFVILDFLAHLNGPRSEPVASTDAQAAKFVAFDQLENYDLVDGLLDFLRAHHLIST